MATVTSLARPQARLSPGRRDTTTRAVCQPQNSARWARPVSGGRFRVAPALDAWAADCRPSDMFSQTFASLESLARELEEGATGLLDPSPLTSWQRQAAPRWRTAATRPLPFDAVEQGDSVLLLFDVPGVKREDVQIKVSPDSVLTVSVERKAPQSVPVGADDAGAAGTAAEPAAEQSVAISRQEDTGEAAKVQGEQKADGQEAPKSEAQRSVVRLERPSGRFARSIRLPKGVEAAAITARLDDGVLTLAVPKAPKQEPASVSIRVD